MLCNDRAQKLHRILIPGITAQAIEVAYLRVHHRVLAPGTEASDEVFKLHLVLEVVTRDAARIGVVVLAELEVACLRGCVHRQSGRTRAVHEKSVVTTCPLQKRAHSSQGSYEAVLASTCTHAGVQRRTDRSLSPGSTSGSPGACIQAWAHACVCALGYGMQHLSGLPTRQSAFWWW